MQQYIRRPDWLRLQPFKPNELAPMRKLTGGLKLHTVCESALCPNRMKCFNEGTASFMILGDVCTRNCTFCAIHHGKPHTPDIQEPEHIVEAIRKLDLRYVVITSVTRDDLEDGGASQFAAVINALKQHKPDVVVEVLIPDFKGSIDALKCVVNALPTVINHNIETVPRLYREVRPGAQYERSLKILRQAKIINNKLLTKSGFMLGLGENRQEVIQSIKDIRESGCDFLTIGQYLQPSLKHHPIARYAPPEEFDEYSIIAKEVGFISVSAGPLVRSSYHALHSYLSLQNVP